MPLELGIDLGCKRYGKPHHQEKVILILDVTPFRYQAFISDIAGQDVEAHNASIQEVIEVVRNWLRLELDPQAVSTPSGTLIFRRYQNFQATLPAICAKLNWDLRTLPFSDFSWSVVDWIANNPINVRRRPITGGRK